MNKIKAIISGGGTGGHIFPAVSIGKALMEANPENEILFVGANGRMEMERVPKEGFEIVGLDVAGLSRKLSLENLKLPFKTVRAILKAKQIIRDFKPDVVIGVGGYASAPVLQAAQWLGIPTLIQEQNGFAGLTNKILGRKAKCICVAYDNMERFFPKERIVKSGNPIRKCMREASPETIKKGIEYYGFTPGKKHIFIVGGSLGCRTFNESMMNWIEEGLPGSEGKVEILWQCGKGSKKKVDEFMAGREVKSVKYTDFIDRMDLAYAAADLVISRSGASSVSEICAMGKACIFVPSPNVTEDHQTHNAMALVDKGAALIIKDSDAREHLLSRAMETLRDEKLLEELSSNALKMALTDADKTIVEQIYRITGK